MNFIELLLNSSLHEINIIKNMKVKDKSLMYQKQRCNLSLINNSTHF